MDTKQYPVTRTEAEWRELLTPEQYEIMREHGTEAPDSCALNFEKRSGKFVCAGCDQALFVSKKKFESGTGWPSFNDPVPDAVETSTDRGQNSQGGESPPNVTLTARAPGAPSSSSGKGNRGT